MVPALPGHLIDSFHVGQSCDQSPDIRWGDNIIILGKEDRHRRGDFLQRILGRLQLLIVQPVAFRAVVILPEASGHIALEVVHQLLDRTPCGKVGHQVWQEGLIEEPRVVAHSGPEASDAYERLLIVQARHREELLKELIRGEHLDALEHLGHIVACTQDGSNDLGQTTLRIADVGHGSQQSRGLEDGIISWQHGVEHQEDSATLRDAYKVHAGNSTGAQHIVNLGGHVVDTHLVPTEVPELSLRCVQPEIVAAVDVPSIVAQPHIVAGAPQ